jgi:hypothetical protein
VQRVVGVDDEAEHVLGAVEGERDLPGAHSPGSTRAALRVCRGGPREGGPRRSRQTAGECKRACAEAEDRRRSHAVPVSAWKLSSSPSGSRTVRPV